MKFLTIFFKTLEPVGHRIETIKYAPRIQIYLGFMIFQSYKVDCWPNEI